MTEHRFLVTVDVNGWENTDGRTSAGYATAALWTAGLPAARSLEGFADMDAEADITGVEPLR